MGRRLKVEPQHVVPVVALVAIIGVLAVVLSHGGGTTTGAAPGASPSVSASAGTSPSSGTGGGHRVKSPAKSDLHWAKNAKWLKNLVEKQTMVQTTTFQVATFNLLGASHTKAGGRHARFASATVRTPRAVQILRSSGASVTGFQEFQPIQHQIFARLMPNWHVQAGAPRVRISGADALGWDSRVWDLVQARSFTVPYFGGHRVAMPAVLLRNHATGMQIWFLNTHNPADAHGPAQKWRNIAVGIEGRLIRTLAASGFPVVLTGDMNDRSEFFCAITGTAPVHAASGGSTGRPCNPPSSMGVDWIVGTTQVQFSNLAVVRSGLIRSTSDHPFVVATATVTSGP